MPFRITVPLLIVAAFVALGVAGLFSGSSGATGDPNVIKFVSSLPRSGSARGQTDSIVNGIRIALAEVNHQIEVTDPDTKEKRTFKLKYEDLDDATAAAGQWTIEQEIANANQARNDPDVMVYIGTYNSGASKVSMPILNRARILMLSPANTAESLTKPKTGERHEPDCYRPAFELDPATGKPLIDPATGDPIRAINFVRVCPTDDLQSQVAGMWIRDLGAKKVYVLDDNEYYGKGISAGLRATLEKYKITVLGSESVDTKAQEFKPLMLKIKTMNPDLIYYAGTTQGKAGQLLKDMQSVGITCPMMGPDGCYEKAMIESAGVDAFEKTKFYVTFGGLTVDGLKALGGRGAAFVQRYKDTFGSEPDEGYAVYGYEAALASLEAIRLAGKKDRDAIRRAALKIKNFAGATGTWSFDANGDTTNQTMSGCTVSKGEFKFERSLTLESPP